MKQRKYLQTLGELIDRLSIVQLKEVFIPDHKEEYAQEIHDILHDIQLILDEKNTKLDAETIRAIIVCSQMNLHIWHNESNYRKGIKDGNNLELTHGLNGIRNTAKNIIQEIVGGRKDYKIDCLAADFKDWEISWSKQSKDANCEVNFVFDEWDNNTPLPNRIKTYSHPQEKIISQWVSTTDSIKIFDNVKVRARRLEDVKYYPSEKFYYHIWFRRSVYSEFLSKGIFPVDNNIVQALKENKNLYLMIMNEQESEGFDAFKSLDKIAKNSGINPQQIFLVLNNERLYEYVKQTKSQINVHNCRTIINIVRSYEPIDFVPEKSGPFFLCHNRTPRIHRYSLLCVLKNKGLLEKDIDWSLVNGWQLNKTGRHINDMFKNIFTFDDIVKYQEEILQITDIKLKKSYYETEYDNFDKQQQQQVVFAEPKSYQNAYVNIVTETNFEEEDIHITEKTFKPFFYFQFPVICGTYQHIKYFKNAYPELDWFDDVIDHSYDDIKNNRDRLHKVVEVIQEINDKKDFYREFYKKNKDRFVKNHEFIKNYVNKYDYNFFTGIS